MTSMELKERKVSTAVGTLVQLAKKLEKKSLVDEVNQVQMQICLKKIPPREKIVKLKLPHSLRHENMEVCLFVKDLDREDRDYEPTVRHFQEMLKKHGVSCVAEIIPLKSLKTEYKPYEAKRNLSNAYDVFLADARVVRLLPTYLGKHFYGKRKTPIQVNLQAKRLKEEIDAALDNSRCVISNRGASSLAIVANLEMGKAEVTDNVISSVGQLSQAVPGGWNNIKQLSVKTPLSTSIPIYLAAGGPQEVTIPKENADKEVVEAEEISTLLGAKVKVYPSGDVEVIKDRDSEGQPQKRGRFRKGKAVGKQSAKTAGAKAKSVKRKAKGRKQS
ncbi:ribosomal L1 domain-containing protein 1 [Aplysia californica]|uniref:Ribosomal L1 domain-containing protein 1 n=1 Tax=Aplysia californica TaxID=6500 RepID=A0ABM1VNW2_APLCA|nr:ribosomal L1 domain-containing protein 1 [Aplysia californica]XP_012934715.1 ribosomal L1 domain-containing protein 1 [Aplysia californica]XP_012934717.1 ribosomal L1 domain-containing protein 1 [Aplysia californica]XP_035824104.1 ribosomal L1 domain-containing protein 1 [Aplysia californica]